MKIYKKISSSIVRTISGGGVGVLATDTIYGIVASALRKEDVERVYAIRQRELDKPMIILISSMDDINIFGISLDTQEIKKISSFWPGKVSVILPCLEKKWQYLHRGTNNLAFRLPEKLDLIELIKRTGPLVAPSANLAGQPPAKTISEARGYFAEEVDFYVDAGEILSEASTIVRLNKKKFIIERIGAVKLDCEE